MTFVCIVFVKRKIYKRESLPYIMVGRAASTTHVEYEILQYIGRKIYLDELMEQMIPRGDAVAEKRFKKGAENICKYLENMADRRLHKLPKNHQDYRGKDE